MVLESSTSWGSRLGNSEKVPPLVLGALRPDLHCALLLLVPRGGRLDRRGDKVADLPRRPAGFRAVLPAHHELFTIGQLERHDELAALPSRDGVRAHLAA